MAADRELKGAERYEEGADGDEHVGEEVDEGHEDDEGHEGDEGHEEGSSICSTEGSTEGDEEGHEGDEHGHEEVS